MLTAMFVSSAFAGVGAAAITALLLGSRWRKVYTTPGGSIILGMVFGQTYSMLFLGAAIGFAAWAIFCLVIALLFPSAPEEIAKNQTTGHDEKPKRMIYFRSADEDVLQVVYDDEQKKKRGT